MDKERFLIGELASRAGMRTSALRYYEEQGLLSPVGHTEAGYRLYSSDSVQIIYFIKKAQQLGFSLTDIRTFLGNIQMGLLNTQAFIEIAQERYLFLEQQVTQLLVLQHELGLFLQDLELGKSPVLKPSSSLQWTRLLEHVCSNPLSRPPLALFDWLLERTGCTLSSNEAQSLIKTLRGQHVHVWREGDGYHILVISKDPNIGQALLTLAEIETKCQVHAHNNQSPELEHKGEGFHLIAHGENAFIFARLFLMISAGKK